ncbi:MAG: metal ABC transporter ATP-binding protein [Patescibacteria group bacterium]|nr:metal ABC transporter ATP-binding protein [Patescibacteria group bacterium]
MAEPILSVKNLSVFLDNRNILNDVSFDIYPKDAVSIVGPNGAGKSTLLKAIVGIVKATDGTVEIAPGTKIGYLPQRFSVDKYLPMKVKEFLKLKPGVKDGQIKKALEEMNLSEEFLEKPLSTLSSGQMQKALIMWVIADEPNLLLFDEPTENVDIVGQESIYQLIHNLQKKLDLAIILVSHDLNVVYKYARHVVCLNQKMLCEGTPIETLTPKILENLYGEHAFFEHHHFGEHHYHEGDRH